MSWNLDEEPYPGPYEHELTMQEVFTLFNRIGTTLGNSASWFGTSTHEFERRLTQGNTTYDNIPPSPREPPVRNYGPRSDQTFDRQGKRK